MTDTTHTKNLSGIPTLAGASVRALIAGTAGIAAVATLSLPAAANDKAAAIARRTR
jgi:hypothetical protein